MIENIADKVERLQRLAREVATSVLLDLKMWVQPDGSIEITWSVWDGHKHHRGMSSESALAKAEITTNIAAVVIPEGVEMP